MLALFNPARVVHGDRMVRGYKIVCGNCGKTEKIAVNSVAGPPNEEQDTRLAARKFTSAGWLIGRRPRDHRCDACAELVVKRTREERVRNKPNGIEPQPPAVLHLAPALTPLINPQPRPEPQPKPQPEPEPGKQGQIRTSEGWKDPPEPVKPILEESAERSMGREDRRVIWAKLEEVYADEATGYKPGWSDGRVARDLNVPLSWVTVVRDENFGALPDNPEIRIIVEEARVLLDMINAQVEKAYRLLTSVNEINGVITSAQNRLQQIERQLASFD
jgi:hypothetical protein